MHNLMDTQFGITLLIVFVSVIILSTVAQNGCDSNSCTGNYYCFFGTSNGVCSPCHPFCVGCNGPGPDECKACIKGYDIISGQCATTTTAPGNATTIFVGTRISSLTEIPSSEKSTTAPSTTTRGPTGTEVIRDLSYTIQNASLVISWTLGQLPLDLKLSYQKVGIGNCETVNENDVVDLILNPTDFSHSFTDLDPGSIYRFTLNVHFATVNQSKTIEAISTEVVPTCDIRDAHIINVTSESAAIGWTEIPCAQQGGSGFQYYVDVFPINRPEEFHRHKSVTSVIIVQGLTPFINYKADIGCLNDAGSGSHIEELQFNTLHGIPEAVTIYALEPSETEIVVYFYRPAITNGDILEYSIMYSATETFVLTMTFNYSAFSDGPPVIQMLTPDTVYYIKARAFSNGGYGPYGDPVHTRTLLPRPFLPSSVNTSLQNATCIGITWIPLDQSTITILGYNVTVVKVPDSPVGSQTLDADATQYNHCGLEAASSYVISIRSFSDGGLSDPVEVTVFTEQEDPDPPTAPRLVNVSFTSVEIIIEPAMAENYLLTAYQIQVETILSKSSVKRDTFSNKLPRRRRKRHSSVPGYVTAEFAPGDIIQPSIFVIGDGMKYGGYINKRLLPGQEYKVYYVVLSTFNNFTKFAYTEMSERIVTLTQPTTKATVTERTGSEDNSVLIIVIICVILFIIAVVAFIMYLYCRQKRKNLMAPPPYEEVLENIRPERTKPNDYVLETFKTHKKIKSSNYPDKRLTQSINPYESLTSYEHEHNSEKNHQQTKHMSQGDKSDKHSINKHDPGNAYALCKDLSQTVNIRHQSKRLPDQSKNTYISDKSPEQFSDVCKTDKSFKDTNYSNPPGHGLSYINTPPQSSKLNKRKFKPENYWNKITKVSEYRYIVTGSRYRMSYKVFSKGDNCDTEYSGLTFEKEFRSLPLKFEHLTTLEAERHPGLNRFRTIVAYDHSRVELPENSNLNLSNYVNASYMSGYKRPKAYIAAQSPFNNKTAEAFWYMVSRLDVKTVVFVISEDEKDEQAKIYWPREGTMQLGPFHLVVLKVANYAHFSLTDIHLKMDGENSVHIVRMYKFKSWPKRTVPDDCLQFLDMRYKVRQYHGSDPSPILVHCKTGTSFTAVFIAVDALLEQYSSEGGKPLTKGEDKSVHSIVRNVIGVAGSLIQFTEMFKVLGDFGPPLRAALTKGRISVYSFVKNMRLERPSMVSARQEYVFIYQSIFEECQAGDTRINATSLEGKCQGWLRRNPETDRSFLRDQHHLLQIFTSGPEAALCTVASLPVNVHKNRYPDIVPADNHRPQLTPANGSSNDYINAVFVDGYRKRNQFIVTQTPLHTTVVDFWRLVYDYNVQTIVMLENEKTKDNSCVEYWSNDSSNRQWNNFRMETTSSDMQDNIRVRNLKIWNSRRSKTEPRQVRHFHCSSWGNTSLIPPSTTTVHKLIEIVLQHQNESNFPESPIVVHCEDGTTASGLFVVLSVMFEQMEDDGDADIYHTIKHVKQRRPQVLDDYVQFKFCYKMLRRFADSSVTGDTLKSTVMHKTGTLGRLRQTSHDSIC